MKTKKLTRIFSSLLALMMLLVVVGCGKQTDSNNVGNSLENSSENNQEANDEQTKETIEEDEVSFTEVIAVDNDFCMIKITEIVPDDMWGYALKAQFENKSSDKTYMFSVENAAINGVQCDPFFATEIAAGKKANDEITFSNDELEENGVGAFTDIELAFRVYDSDDWLADPVAAETVHIYPYGEDKATVFVRESQPTDNVILDNEYVTVIVTGYENDDIWGYTANLFLLNKTDKNVMFSIDEASVNGFMADPFFADSVSAEKCAFSSVSWSDSTLEENGITEVEEIEFVLRAYDDDNWLGDNFANEVITLNP